MKVDLIREQFIMSNGKIGCLRKDGSLRLHFKTQAEAQACIDKYGWDDEEPRLCHCGYYHAEKEITEVAN